MADMTDMINSILVEQHNTQRTLSPQIKSLGTKQKVIFQWQHDQSIKRKSFVFLSNSSIKTIHTLRLNKKTPLHSAFLRVVRINAKRW